jgi:hypothetical protein
LGKQVHLFAENTGDVGQSSIEITDLIIYKKVWTRFILRLPASSMVQLACCFQRNQTLPSFQRDYSLPWYQKNHTLDPTTPWIPPHLGSHHTLDPTTPWIPPHLALLFLKAKLGVALLKGPLTQEMGRLAHFL